MNVRQWSTRIALILLAILYVALPVPSQSPSPTATPIVIQVQSPPKDLLDYLLAGIQMATLIGLIIYVIKTWQIASATRRATEVSQEIARANQRATELSQDVLAEMKAARSQEIAPHVIVYIDIPYGRQWSMFFVVKNIGKSVAKDIKLTFEPTLMTGFGNKIRELNLSLIKEGISSLAPGQEIRTPFDSINNYFENPATKLLDGKLPTRYTVQVSFSGGLEQDRVSTEQVIDYSMFKDLRVLEEKGEKDLIHGIETIADSHKRMQRYFEDIAYSLVNGIWLKNTSFEVLGLALNLEVWKQHTLVKLNEFKILWTSIYAGNYQRPVRLYVEDLQSRISTLSSQLLIIVSNAPSTVPTELKNALIAIVVKLNQLSEAQWFMNGEVSEPDFNITGNQIITFVDKAIDTLNSLSEQSPITDEQKE